MFQPKLMPTLRQNARVRETAEKEPLMTRSLFADSDLGSDFGEPGPSTSAKRPCADLTPCTSRSTLGTFPMEESGYQSVMWRSHRSPIGTCWMLTDALSVASSNGSEDWDGYMTVGNEKVQIRDVCDLLSTRYAFVSGNDFTLGARTSEGRQIVTFPDVRVQITFPEYKRLLTYLLDVPVQEDVYQGCVVIVDRRLDRWPSVKVALTQLMTYFPASLHAVFVIKPEGLLQKTLEFGYKGLVEACKFRIFILQSVQELHFYIKPASLTLDLAGKLRYNHLEWVQHRMDIERMMLNTQIISKSLQDFDQCLRDTELPNDAETTKHLLDSQKAEREAIKEDFRIAVRKGLCLLQNIRQAEAKPTADQLSPTRLRNVTKIERLLIQLEETERGFDRFWCDHERKLQQCLQLRTFENQFRQLQTNFAMHMLHLEENREVGETATKAQELLTLHEDYVNQAKADIVDAERLRLDGEQLIFERHYATDASVRPKCQELRRLADALHSAFQRRMDVLRLSKQLHEQINAANTWCSTGVRILSDIPYELGSREESLSCLGQLQTFLGSSADLNLDGLKNFQNPELKNLVLMATTDTSSLLQQVIARIDDVKLMCEKRADQLQKIADKENRKKPVQPVSPERKVSEGAGNVPLHPSVSSSSLLERKRHSAKLPSPKRHIEVLHDYEDTSQRRFSLTLFPVASPSSSLRNSPGDTNMACVPSPSCSGARREDFVVQELLQTEAIYVEELEGVLETYLAGFSDPRLSRLLPECLRGAEDRLFGNLAEIYQFHKSIFLEDLYEASRDYASAAVRVAHCFLERRDHFYMYMVYCQNKPASEALRQQCGEFNPFFQECQRLAGHRLPLSAYLLKPVQRITKYQLLLKELSKCTKEREKCAAEVEQALSCMLDLLTQLNACILHISGFPANIADLGQLLLQAKCSVWTTRKTADKGLKFRRTAKVQQRHLFLYSKALLLCKHRQQALPFSQEYYEFKAELPLSTLGLADEVKGSPHKFEVWSELKAEVFTLQLLDGSKQDWITKLKQLIFQNTQGNTDGDRPRPRPVSWCSMTSGDSSSRSSRDLSSTPEFVERTSPNGDSNNNPSSPVNLPGVGERQFFIGSGDTGALTEVSDSENNTIIAAVPTPASTITNACHALYNYSALTEDELSLTAGEKLQSLTAPEGDWTLVQKADVRQKGWVPTKYLQLST